MTKEEAEAKLKKNIFRIMNRPGFVGTYADAHRQLTEENKIWKDAKGDFDVN